MKLGSFEFNLRELSGSMGDFGTLFPLAVGYIIYCNLNPAGFLVMMGLSNIITGIIYKLPMPIEPMKVIAIVAITQKWHPSLVYAAGFSMGVIWTIFSFTGIMERLAKITPNSVVKGIQISLGLMLIFSSYNMISTFWLLGGISILIIIFLHENKYAPAAVILMILGILIIFFNGNLKNITFFKFTLPPFTTFSFNEIFQGIYLAGLSQIPLTATNAIISTAALIKAYWPKRDVSVKNLSLNMGIMNLIIPFFGGFPLCHGAGGLAGQYYFGARTGGTNIIEGSIEIILGLFFSSSIAKLFTAFPPAIIGGMMFMVGIELIKFVKDIKLFHDKITTLVTVILSITTNIPIGFLAGILVDKILFFYKSKTS